MMRNAPVTLLTLLLSSAALWSIACAEESLEPIQVGKPARIEVFPEAIELSGPRRQAQLVVTGYYDDGTLQDLTRAAKYSVGDAQIATVDDTVVRPHADGSTDVTVHAGGHQVQVAVTVRNFQQPQPISFTHGALVALSKQGCNAGACHGSPSGKGGFRLSLRAFDPQLDRMTLIREEFGRRTNPLDPEASLLLAKPLMRVPHGGGLKLTKQQPAYDVLHDWIAEGCRLDEEDAARCVRLEIYPPTGRVFKRPAHTQQLSVRAHFDDGTVRDVTPMAVYSSSDEEVASITDGGLVVGHDRGEAAVMIRYLDFIDTAYFTFVSDVQGFAWKAPPAANYVDERINEKLQQLKYLPSESCDDEEFVRRVYLDVIGILPTIDETQAFLADKADDKRTKLIDQLLERPEYARFWALKWGDLLRMTAGQVGDEGVYKYHRWVQRAFAENMPYDQFAAELLSASGSTLANPPANFYRTSTDVNDCVETVSQIFLGARLQCAKCHNHPFERWTQDNYYGLAAFFNRVQRSKSQRTDDLVIWSAGKGEVTQPRTGQQMKPWLPLEGETEPSANEDRRKVFARWLTKPGNAFLAKVEVNRIWGELMGRGIVEPVDDFRDSNPPSNAALLDALAKDFEESGFDRKHILRTILNSRTYQASSRTNAFNQDDAKYFSHYEPRLLTAEQLLDAICHLTSVPEKFGNLPTGTKATQLPSPDLAESDFMKIFGQPERQTVCECERSSDSNLGQALQLYNGPLVHGKLRSENNRLRRLLASGKSPREIIETLYLAALSRKPSEDELKTLLAHLQSKPDAQAEALEDVCWAILNMNEFLFQH
ncbi:MAG: DUF1549 and DUF1553 domain-containing protein [Pirellulaceae bacterium]